MKSNQDLILKIKFKLHFKCDYFVRLKNRTLPILLLESESKIGDLQLGSKYFYHKLYSV